MKRSIILLAALVAAALALSQAAFAATEEDRIVDTLRSIRTAFVDARSDNLAKSFDSLAKTVNPKAGLQVYGVKLKYDEIKNGENDTKSRKFEFTMYGEKRREELTLPQLFFGMKSVKGWLHDFFVDLSVDDATFVPGLWYVPKDPSHTNRAVIIWDGKTSSLIVIKGTYDSDHVVLKKSGKTWYFAEYTTST